MDKYIKHLNRIYEVNKLNDKDYLRIVGKPRETKQVAKKETATKKEVDVKKEVAKPKKEG